jgi:hypothetical protein
MFIPSQSMWEIHRQLYQQRLSRTADTQMSMPLVAGPRFAAFQSGNFLAWLRRLASPSRTSASLISPEVANCCQASLSGTA